MTKTSSTYQYPTSADRREHWLNSNRYEQPPLPNVVIEIEDTTSVEVEPQLAPAQLNTVVDVRVVEFAREPDRYRDCLLTQITVPAGGRTALPIRRQRQSFQLVNAHAADTLYVGMGADVNAVTGFPLLAQKTLPLQTQRQLHFYNPGANDIVLGIVEEFVTELV